jgi:hypothetical protein
MEVTLHRIDAIIYKHYAEGCEPVLLFAYLFKQAETKWSNT